MQVLFYLLFLFSILNFSHSWNLGEECCTENNCTNSLCPICGASLCHTSTSQTCNVYSGPIPPQACYCRCSCLSGNTSVAVPSPVNSIILQDLQQSDTVLVVSLDNGTEWVQETVTLVFPTSSATEYPFVLFVEVDSINGTFICTSDHTFLQPNRTLVQASQLVGGTSVILDASFTPRTVTNVSSGSYNGIILNVGIGEYLQGNLSKHILNTGGILSGDVYAQTEFDGENPTLPHPSWKIRESDIISIPSQHVSFVQQGKVNPSSSKSYIDLTKHRMAKFLLDLYSYHFPNIKFALNWFVQDANAVAFWNSTTPTIVLHGGLVRHKELNSEGLELVIAHLLGYFVDDEIDTIAEADLFAGQVVRLQWWGDIAIQRVREGTKQLDEFFKEHEDDQHCTTLGLCTFQTAYPDDSCRIKTFRNSITLRPILPSCGYKQSPLSYVP